MKKRLKDWLTLNVSRLLIIPLITVTSTAYCLTGQCADGSKPRKGIVAYTKEMLGKTAIVYTEDLTEVIGIYEVKDVCPSNTLDIWNESEEWCRNYGRQTVQVQFIDAKG